VTCEGRVNFCGDIELVSPLREGTDLRFTVPVARCGVKVVDAAIQRAYEDFLRLNGITAAPKPIIETQRPVRPNRLFCILPPYL